MEKGHIVSRGGLRWNKDDENPSFWIRKGYSSTKTEILIGNGTWGTSIEAYRYGKDRMVIFTY